MEALAVQLTRLTVREDFLEEGVSMRVVLKDGMY